MNYNPIFSILLLLVSLTAFGQKKEIEISGVLFSLNQVQLDDSEGEEKQVVELYRGDKKLLTHTVFKQEGDCSSIHIQLGKYQVVNNTLVFYTYWAAADRMPGSNLPFGFRKQQYSVDSLGVLRLIASKIYLESAVSSQNKSYLEINGWVHKGLKYLNETTKNEYEQKLVEDYIQNIENEYFSDFVLNEAKEALEKEIRNNLSEEIKIHTKEWIEGEVYGRVKK